jgi:hypothetical protein
VRRWESYAAAALSGLLAGRIARNVDDVEWADAVRDAWDIADTMEAETLRRTEEGRGGSCRCHFHSGTRA